MPYVLSRSSRLYEFVFGNKKGWSFEGFPEPGSDRISSGIFIGLLLVVLIMRPLASLMITMIEIMLRIVSFLADGSYVQGSLTTHLRFVAIRPWPTIRGRRVSPWLILATGIIAYLYQYVGVRDAAGFLIFSVFVTAVASSIKPGDRILTEEIAESVGPAIDARLRLSYFREPKLFPAIHLVD